MWWHSVSLLLQPSRTQANKSVGGQPEGDAAILEMGFAVLAPCNERPVPRELQHHQYSKQPCFVLQGICWDAVNML